MSPLPDHWSNHDDIARQQERNREIAAELAREHPPIPFQPSLPSNVVYFWDDTGRSIQVFPQQKGDGKMGFNLGQLISTLQAAGLTPAVAAQAVQTLAVNSPNTAVMSICNVILANSNNPSVIKDECVKLAEIPNLSQSVAVLIPSLASATDPVQIMNIVHLIEQNMRGTSIFSLGSSGF